MIRIMVTLRARRDRDGIVRYLARRAEPIVARRYAERLLEGHLATG
jgi:plasmid stabilization system protein ParE